jgi:ATP-dependent DNA helicase RecG
MMDADRLKGIIALGEAVVREFKSDRRKLSDAEIYEEIVAMANADGGVLLVGVEDDGMVCGAQPRHEETTDPIRLQSAIFNNTSPNINTRISIVVSDNPKGMFGHMAFPRFVTKGWFWSTFKPTGVSKERWS